MTSGKSIVLALFATTLLACAGESFVNTTGENGAGAAGQSAGGAGSGGSASGNGGSDAGQGGSDAGSGGSNTSGSGGSDAGAAGSGAGAGGSDAGQGGSDAGAGGSEAGSGGSDAGQGGSDAGSGGSNTSGSGGSDGGSGGSEGGSGGSDAGSGGSDAGSGGSDAGSGGSDAGSGGSDAGAGGSSTAGSGGSGGDAGQGGSSGAGGAPPSCLTGEVTCSGNQYCNADTGACAPCGDMNRFEFGEVEGLQAGLNFAQRSFPRVEFAGEVLRMHFRMRGSQSWENFDIARVDPPYMNGTVEPCCVNKPADDSGPLPLPQNTTSAQLSAFAPNVGNPPSGTRFFLLDSKRGYGGFGLSLPEGPRRIFLASQTGQPNDYYYEPIQKLNGGVNDYSVAYAHGANSPRFYWISERMPELGGGSVAVAGLYTVVALDASSKANKVPVLLEGCSGEAAPEDLAPWVFPNGNHLLFHARCSPEEPLALYHAALTPNGVFAGPAKKIKVDLEGAGAEPKALRTPSLSPNRCDLFFEGDNTIYRAKRR